MLKIHFLLSKSDILNYLSAVDSNGLTDLLLCWLLKRHLVLLLTPLPHPHHLISLVNLAPVHHPHAPTIHMIVRLQHRPRTVPGLLQVGLAVVQSRKPKVESELASYSQRKVKVIKPGITVEASIRLEASVHVVVEASLNAGLELLRAILTLEVLSLVSSHNVIVQLQLLFSAERANLPSFCCSQLVHALHVRLQIAPTWKRFVTLLTHNVLRVDVFMHSLDVIA